MNQNTEETMMRRGMVVTSAQKAPDHADRKASSIEASSFADPGDPLAFTARSLIRVVERIVAKYISTREGGGAVVISKDLITALAVMIESS